MLQPCPNHNLRDGGALLAVLGSAIAIAADNDHSGIEFLNKRFVPSLPITATSAIRRRVKRSQSGLLLTTKESLP
jgi:hypothetical protein